PISSLCTDTYSLSLHDALPISSGSRHPLQFVAIFLIALKFQARVPIRLPEESRPLGGSSHGRTQTGIAWARGRCRHAPERLRHLDRKSTRLNSSHGSISYAVFG